MAIACSGENSGGRRTSQSPSTRAIPARPPQWASPTPHPLRITVSPAAQSRWVDSTTVPAKSMPGTIGNERITLPLPVMASASL